MINSDYLDLIAKLSRKTSSKIILLVMDGLGGFPISPDSKTELETANTPNMDKLAREGTCGLLYPVGRGITPGSGPGHLSLFGYSPLTYEIGRGVLESIGIGLDVQPGDVAVRLNFCTLDGKGNVIDRRAGRIPTQQSRNLVEKMHAIKIPGIEISMSALRDHRAAVVFRGKNLAGNIADNDPQDIGIPALPITALDDNPATLHTVKILNEFNDQAHQILSSEYPANGILMRGVDGFAAVPHFSNFTKMRAASIAVYPMYRGVTKLLGMEILDCGETVLNQMETLKQHFDEFDFFFIHIKKTDSYGEDGKFNEKVVVIEEVDAAIPELMKLAPDVLAITGDHSSPAAFEAHSFHPVPLMIWSPQYVLSDYTSSFGERACMSGGIGHLAGVELLPILMAYADKLNKFGA